MSVQVQILFYDSPERLDLEPGALYLMFGFGTGDTFNAMIHLRKAPPLRDYELIIKRPQLNLVMFLLGLFERLPRRVHAVDYWQHDFSPQVAGRFPAFPYARGMEGHSAREGFIDVWLHPFNYDKLIPLEPADIDAMLGYFRQQPPARPLPQNSVVLFPTAGTNFSDYVPPWESLVASLRQKGFEHIYVNQSGVAEYGAEAIGGAEPLNLAHDELIRTFHAEGAKLRLIAVRSGVLDILRFCGQRALVLYQPVPRGIFETCRFGLLKHRFDLVEAICLNTSAPHQDQVLEYYLQHFIASPLE